MTEPLHFHFSLSCIGEGNGNPLQCSCLENPRDGGAWWASVYGVAQSRTRMKQLSSSSSRCKLIYIGWINNKVLLFNMGNCIQYPVINHKGKEYKKQCLYTCIRLTMLYSIVHTGHSKLPLTTTQEMTLPDGQYHSD